MAERKFKGLKHELNYAFDNLIYCQEHGRLSKELSGFMTRPAYYGTSIQQKKIFINNTCDECGYWRETEFWKRVCTFPWEDPKEHDRAVAEYLPCVREGDHEMD